MVDDSQLLQQYVRKGSQDAFAQIVTRYADMVYSTCLRRLGNREAAQDAAQTVFVTLARKALTLPSEITLGGWLYRTARFEAAQTARAAETRRRHEMAAAGQRPESSARDDPRLVVDEQLARAEELDCVLELLRTPEREAVVLRYFGGKSFAEVARELHVSEESARKRVSRGLEKLRRLLRPPASAVTASALPAVAVERLLEASVYKAPASLVPATMKAVAAIPIVTGAGAVVSKGALITMAITKGKAIAAGALLLLVCGGGAVVAYHAVRPPATQVVVLQPTTSVTAPQWRSRFDEVYGLSPNQPLKFVPPPFIPERNLFWQSEQRRNGNANPGGLDPAFALTVEQDGSQMRWRIVTTVASVGSAFRCAAGIDEADLDASVPTSMPLPGDWVVRKGASTDQLTAGIAEVLSRKLGRTVRLERRHVTRDAIVVHGAYHFVPLPGKPDNGVVELLGDPPPQSLPSQKRQVKLGELLRGFGGVNGLAIVDETGQGDKPVTIADHPTYGNPMTVLRNIAAQTSLRLVREPRPRDLWFLVDPANAH